LCLGSANCQKSRWKVKIYVDEKSTFLKEACHLKGWPALLRNDIHSNTDVYYFITSHENEEEYQK